MKQEKIKRVKTDTGPVVVFRRSQLGYDDSAIICVCIETKKPDIVCATMSGSLKVADRYINPRPNSTDYASADSRASFQFPHIFSRLTAQIATYEISNQDSSLVETFTRLIPFR